MRVVHPLDEVHHRRLHHQLHAGSLGCFQTSEERQPVVHRRDRLGGQPPGVLLQPSQQGFGHGIQQFER